MNRCHPMNNLKHILLSYKERGESLDEFMNRVPNDKTIMRELMNSVEPVMSLSHLLSIITDRDFINTLRED